MLELAFVMRSDQNWFFHDLVAAIRAELDEIGVSSGLHLDGIPAAATDRIPVFVPPHEYVALGGEGALPDAVTLARSIFICAEQPDTVHFEGNLMLASRAGALFDINARAMRAFRSHGIHAEHLQVGYSQHWDHFDEAPDRPLDVVFMGCDTPRRTRLLNGYARVLSRWNCHLQLSDNSRPNPGASPSFLTEQKWDLLSRAKILINLHQGEEPYFEWMRAVDAIHCGAVLLSEPSTGSAPLLAGTHFLAGRVESLALIADRVLRDDARLASVRSEAYAFLRGQLPLRAAAQRLVAVAERLVATPLDEPGTATRLVARRERPKRPPPPATPPRDALTPLRGALKELRLDLMDIRRRMIRDEIAQRDGSPVPLVEHVASTTSWRARRAPAVTLITALYNHRELIAQTLDSVLTSSSLDELEVVVVDDGSSDGSGEAVLDWMRDHDRVPVTLVRHPVNRGLGAARNTAIDFARARYCFVLDADNEIYPRCLKALCHALDTQPHATFAYPMLEAFGQVEAYLLNGGSPLLSRFAWEPKRLREGNFIDAMALIRTAALREVSGYSTDRRMYGWEDYDLWCNFAERGWWGVHVPQMLGRYRTSPASMLSLTNLGVTASISALVERYPTLMAGVTAPS